MASMATFAQARMGDEMPQVSMLAGIVKKRMNYAAVGIGVALGMSFFFLYTRKKDWSQPILRWLISGCLFTAGSMNLFLSQGTTNSDRIFYWGLCVPLLYYGLDRLFRFLSFRIQRRDFILWLNGSDEIDGRVGGKNPHVRPSDIVFSLGLLIFIVAVTLMGAAFLRQT
jgi:hypothetical protein